MSLRGRALRDFIQYLGGEPLNDHQFEMPLSETRRIIPEINKVGWQCDKVSERQGTDFNGHAISLAVIELKPPPEKTEYSDQRNLMWAAIR